MIAPKLDTEKTSKVIDTENKYRRTVVALWLPLLKQHRKNTTDW